MQLSSFSSRDFDRGANRFKEAMWLILSGLIVESWLPGSTWRCSLLRLFGAGIGERVVIKPRVRVKFPWRLEIANDVWIGEGVWIDNLGTVSIGHDSCISQGAYFCTGSHDWGRSTFDLIVKPIVVSDHVWVGAKAKIAPGTHIGDFSVVGIGVTISGNLEPNHVVTMCRKAAFNKRARRVPGVNY